jgi:hypothetical protein
VAQRLRRDGLTATLAFSGTLVLHAPAIPDFNTVPLPYELVDGAQAILWAMAG